MHTHTCCFLFVIHSVFLLYWHENLRQNRLKMHRNTCLYGISLKLDKIWQNEDQFCQAFLVRSHLFWILLVMGSRGDKRAHIWTYIRSSDGWVLLKNIGWQLTGWLFCSWLSWWFYKTMEGSTFTGDQKKLIPQIV